MVQQQQHTAIVAGAYGVVGRSLVAHLERRGDWQVVDLGQRWAPPDQQQGPRSRFVAVDLTDAAATRAALSDLPPAEAMFYGAYAPRPTPAEEVRPIRTVAVFAAFLERSSSTATAEDIRRVQIHQSERGMNVPAMNSALSRRHAQTRVPARSERMISSPSPAAPASPKP